MPTLYVVGTPIGNLQDMSDRVKNTLAQVQLIAAEDTRVTAKLLNHLGLKTPMVSCHEHNETESAQRILQRMETEQIDVALVTDAGTPAVSDPGARFVQMAVQRGFTVTPICGPSAVVAAMSISGLDTDNFAFYGFLPREKAPLREKLLEIGYSGIQCAVVYESPHRVENLLRQIGETLPGANLVLCGELTKRFESQRRGTAEEVLQAFLADENAHRGEYVLVMDLRALQLPAPQEQTEMPAEARIFCHMLEGCDLAKAARLAMEQGVPRNEAYRAKLRVQRFFEELEEEETEE